MYAAWKRHLEILKLLIASEADLELKTHARPVARFRSDQNRMEIRP
jgi:hypothetical protein